MNLVSPEWFKLTLTGFVRRKRGPISLIAYSKNHFKKLSVSPFVVLTKIAPNLASFKTTPYGFRLDDNHRGTCMRLGK